MEFTGENHREPSHSFGTIFDWYCGAGFHLILVHSLEFVDLHPLQPAPGAPSFLYDPCACSDGCCDPHDCRIFSSRIVAGIAAGISLSIIFLDEARFRFPEIRCIRKVEKLLI